MGIFSTIKIKRLIKNLLNKKNNQKNRYEAAVALGKIGQQAVPLLTQKLKEKDENLKRWVICALQQIGDHAINSLILALYDSDMNIRDYASKALSEIGHTAEEPLLDTMKDENPNVRRGAVIAIGSIGSEKTVDVLINLLKDKEWFVRERAAEALGKIGSKNAVEPLIKALDDESERVRIFAANALLDIGNEIIPSLINAYEKAGYTLKKLICKILNILDSIEQITSDDLQLLVKNGDSDVNGSIELACKAAVVLGQMHQIEAIKVLQEVIEKKKSPVLYWQAAEALGMIGNSDIAVEMRKSLNDSHPLIRKGAMSYLSHLGEMEGTQPKLDVLNDNSSSSQEKHQALFELFGIKSEKVVCAIHNFFSSLFDEHGQTKDPLLAAEGAACLLVGGDQSIMGLLTAFRDSKNGGCSFLAEMALTRACEYARYGVKPKLGLDLLIDCLKKRSKKDAAEALGKMCDRKAVDPLIAFLDDDDKFVWIESAKALGEIGARETIPHIVKKLGQDSFADSYLKKALEALLFVE